MPATCTAVEYCNHSNRLLQAAVLRGRATTGGRGAHHDRTRSSGEQQGSTVKATGLTKARSRTLARVNPQASRKCPQLPKLVFVTPPRAFLGPVFVGTVTPPACSCLVGGSVVLGLFGVIVG